MATQAVLDSVSNLWLGVAALGLPIVKAIIVIVIGLVVAWLVSMLIERFVSAIRIESVIKKIGWDVYFERAGVQLSVGRFFGFLFYWFLVIVFTLAAVDILELQSVSLFLRDVLDYIPQIAAAVLIMLASILIANFIKALVKGAVASGQLHGAKFLGTLSWWSIIIVGIYTSLFQLGINVVLLQTIITGVIAMLALAGGIAFGLGGKEYAGYLLNRLREETERRRS